MPPDIRQRRITAKVLVCLALLLAFAIRAAHAQVTTVSNPTTTTLWAGTADPNVDGLTSMTAPASGVILQGTAISAITGLPVRHMWYGDPIQGVCRIDPEVDAVVPPTAGIGGHFVALTTCVGIGAVAISPGQLAFDASSNTLYTEDTSRTNAGIIRMKYLPGGDNGQGSIDPISITSLIGGLQRGSCPQVKDPKTGSLVPIVPNSAAIGPDGNLYVGSIRDGALIRIISPATFNPVTDCPPSGPTPGPTDKIQIPILSADEAVGSGHTFGLGWVGSSLFGADNVAPWLMVNGAQCFTSLNGNKMCAAPALGGQAPMPTHILGTLFATTAPQGGAVSDAQYPNFPGSAAYFAAFPNLVKITNILDPNTMTVQSNYGGAFSFITGMTADPVNQQLLYVNSDPTQGGITGSGAIYQVAPALCPSSTPLAPSSVTAVAGSGQASVSWVPGAACQPVTSYVVRTVLAGGAASGVPDVTVGAGTGTTTTVTGLTIGVSYQFEVQACNLAGCSAFSALSNVVTPFACTAPSAPTGVTALPGNNSATVAWVATSPACSPITSSTVSAYDSLAPTVLAATATVPAPATGAVVSGLINGRTYTFTVHETNSIGNSAESAPSLPITLPLAGTVDMSITMAAPGSVFAGSTLTYTLSVANLGPSSVTQANVSATLPAPLASFTFSQGVCASAPGSNVLVCNLGAMAAGSTASVTASASLSTTTSGLVSGTASVSAVDATGTAISDPNPANNVATATTVVSINPCTATTTDIQVTGSAQNGGPALGSTDTFTWQIKNNQGNTTASCVVFTSTLPSNFTLNSVTGSGCSSLGNAITCNLGTIGGGSTDIVTVNFNVGKVAGTFSTTGSATFTGTDTNTANNFFNVTIQPK